MADAQIDNDVRDVLSRAECAGSALRLPPGQLDRKLYERVNKALANAGGKWNRSAKAHLFAGDADAKLMAMLETGVSVDEKKRDQAFFTPPDLARQVATLADVRFKTVLEPSAGMGALARACKQAGADRVKCIELNGDYASSLHSEGYETTQGNFLMFPCKGEWQQVERIVMNPPFAKNQDIKHVDHALTWLAPRGILVAIMLDNQSRKGFQEIAAQYDPEIIEVGRGAFKESGTNIATIIVKIVKPY